MPFFGTLGEFNARNESWETYVDRMDEFFVANNVTQATTKRAILNSNVGTTTYQLLANLVSPKKPKELTYDELVEKLIKHYSPAKSSIMARHDFDNRLRRHGESVLDYLATLRVLAQDCKFGEALDTRLRDRFVTGINDTRMSKNLMMIPEDRA